MSTILEKLKIYFENNSHEQFLKDWDSLSHFDNIGPRIGDILHPVKHIFVRTGKGTFLVIEGEEQASKMWGSLPFINKLSEITEEQASGIVDSLISGTVLGKLVTNLENHRIEIYQHEGKNIKFISAVNCLHSLLKSKGIHLFQNTVPDPECLCDGFNDDDCNFGYESKLKEEAEQKTFYNPYIFKLND